MIEQTQHLIRVRPLCAFALAAASVALPLLAGTPAAHAQDYSLTTVVTFNGTGPDAKSGDGGSPLAGVTIDSSGNLYGTALTGGPGFLGTAFEIAAGTNTATVLAAFDGGGNGGHPAAALVRDSSGNIYGTTSEGGANNDGTLFEIAAGNHVVTSLAAFNGSGNGIGGGGLIFDSHGNLFGVTGGGGTDGDGTIFEIAAGTNILSTVATFNGSGNGSDPNGLMFDSSGNIYGTTGSGGAAGDGTVFEITAGTTAVKTIVTFNGSNGADPDWGLSLDNSGNLYGTTAHGTGADEYGTIYKIAGSTNTFSTFVSFTGINFLTGVGDGATPGGVTIDNNGNIYGALANGDGSIYKIAAGSNIPINIANFNGTNGDAPNGQLTLDSNGDIYGTTQEGNTSLDGSVFELTPVGAASAPEPGALTLLLPAAGTFVAIRGVARRRNGTRH